MKKHLAVAAAALLVGSLELSAQTAPTQDQRKGNPKLDATTSTNDDTSRTSVGEFPGAAGEGGAVAGSRGREGTSTQRRSTTARQSRNTTPRSRTASRIEGDLSRLRTILIDLTTHPNVADEAVRITANEAFMLANRISGRTASLRGADARRTARELRSRVAEMRSDLRSGDRTDAMRNAGDALRLANELAGATAGAARTASR